MSAKIIQFPVKEPEEVITSLLEAKHRLALHPKFDKELANMVQLVLELALIERNKKIADREEDWDYIFYLDGEED